MKKVLITGANSYVGTNVEKWLMKEPNKYYVETLDMKDPNWKDFDFSIFDVVFHVAGIAHVSAKKSMKDIYFRVNRDLVIDTAIKAKESGVNQFIFMSSIIVYGNSRIRDVITRETIPNPADFYGLSKLQAEQRLLKLETNKFKIVILRPPLIYGKNSKGNYSKLSKMSQRLPVFPLFPNKRSMLFIGNLNEFIKLVIDRDERGMYFPQNKEYIQTSCLVKTIASIYDNKIWMTRVFNPLLRVLLKTRIVNKVFGSLVYEKSISHYPQIHYQIYGFEESIKLSETERAR
jgi:nucleoside-diphosphate-sugar epimerase